MKHSEDSAVTATNIKDLPEGNYFTEIGYSERYPWREVSRTAKTVTLQKVLVRHDPEWAAKREFIPGGFCGHVPNQSEQTWLYKGLGQSTMRIFKTKRGWGRKGVRFVEGAAHEFYDYNF